VFRGGTLRQEAASATIRGEWITAEKSKGERRLCQVAGTRGLGVNREGPGRGEPPELRPGTKRLENGEGQRCSKRTMARGWGGSIWRKKEKEVSGTRGVEDKKRTEVTEMGQKGTYVQEEGLQRKEGKKRVPGGSWGRPAMGIATNKTKTA